ncbi:MAG: CvpA family protein [Sphingomonadaceae bacterium]|nr:CvpA family protein [Sphingomonadaceae bacterium]
MAANALTALDIVVLLLIVLGGAAGFARGFVTEVLSLLAWVAAFFAVRLLYPAGQRIALHVTHTESGAAILAFAVIFLTTFIAFRMVAAELGDRTRSSIVGPVDRVLGLGFGAFKGLLFGAVIWLVLGLAMDTMDGGGPRPAWLTASRTAPLLEVTSRSMVDFVEKRRHPVTPPADSADPADPVLPPGHPPILKGHGYSQRDRSDLDKLLDAGNKTPL